MKLMSERRRAVWVVLSGLAWTVPAFCAAEVDVANLSLEQLLEVKVVSASRFEQRGREAPSAVQVISREEIRRHGWATLTEALNTLPGLYANTDKAYDFQGARGFQIPGDYNARFLLLIDGQRNNDNIYHSAMTGTEGWLDMAAVERIEYIPGPGSALYGSSAMFDVINVITRKGERNGGNELALRMSNSLGNGINLTSSLSIKGAEEDTRVFLQYSTDDKSGRNLAYSDPLGQLRLADGSLSLDGLAHGLDSGKNQRFLARIDRGDLSFRLISHERISQPSSAAYLTVFDDPALRLVDGGTQMQVTLKHAFSPSSSLQARLGYSDFYYRASYPYLDPSLGRYLNFDDTRGQVLDGELQYEWRGESHRVVAGLELSRDLQASQRNFSSVPADQLGTADADINTLIQRSAIFVQDLWRIQDSLTLSLGLRMDSATGQDTTTSPRLGMIWQAAQDWTFKFLTGRAYRSPSAYEAQFSNGITYLRNPGLQSETINTTEGVMEWRHKERTRLQLSLYQNRLENLIAQTNTGSGLQFQNQGSTTIHGAELGLEQRQPSGLIWRASLAGNRASNSLTTTVDNSPQWLVKGSASSPLLAGRVTLAGELQMISPRDYLWNGTPYAVPAEVLAHVTATFPNLLARGWKGQLRITNLFDQTIAHPASAEIPSPRVPQPGRRVSATLGYAF